MKRILLFLLAFALLASPAGAMREVGYDDPIYPTINRVEAETAAYMSLPNPTLDIVTVNDRIRAVKYGSGVALTSQTMNLSTVNGTAFITNPLTDLRWAVGFKATITAGGKTLIGWIKAVGLITGEMCGDELLTDTWTNNPSYPYETFAQSGTSITSAINNTGAEGEASHKFTGALTVGALYKWVHNLTLNSGTVPRAVMSTTLYGATQQSIYSGLLGEMPTGATNKYLTITVSGLNYLYPYNGAVASNFSLTNSFKVVSTPSATGVTIVSAQGGATYNWTSDDGISPNSATYTITITAS